MRPSTRQALAVPWRELEFLAWMFALMVLLAEAGTSFAMVLLSLMFGGDARPPMALTAVIFAAVHWWFVRNPNWRAAA